MLTIIFVMITIHLKSDFKIVLMGLTLGISIQFVMISITFVMITIIFVMITIHLKSDFK